MFLHDDAVYGISVNPENSNVFATACDDGRILVYDMREPPATGISTDVSYSFTLIHVKYDFILPTCTCTSMFILHGIGTYMYSWVQMLISGVLHHFFSSICNSAYLLYVFIIAADAICLASYSSSMHAVMYNPVEARLIATANAKEGLGLWDVRKPKR